MLGLGYCFGWIFLRNYSMEIARIQFRYFTKTYYMSMVTVSFSFFRRWRTLFLFIYSILNIFRYSFWEMLRVLWRRHSYNWQHSTSRSESLRNCGSTV